MTDLHALEDAMTDMRLAGYARMAPTHNIEVDDGEQCDVTLYAKTDGTMRVVIRWVFGSEVVRILDPGAVYDVPKGTLEALPQMPRLVDVIADGGE